MKVILMTVYKKFAQLSVLAMAGLAMTGQAAAAVIDFESFSDAEYVNQVPGVASIKVTRGGIKKARIYDTNVGHRTDKDLNYGNVGFTSLTTGETGVDLGNVLIIQESDKDTPDDFWNGGRLVFTFDQPLTLNSVDILDANTETVRIDLYGVGNSLLGRFYTSENGDTDGDPNVANLFETISFTNGGMSIAGVTKMKIISNTSFAVDNINYVVPIPAAAWLFGSALLGLVGVGRLRKGS